MNDFMHNPFELEGVKYSVLLYCIRYILKLRRFKFFLVLYWFVNLSKQKLTIEVFKSQRIEMKKKLITKINITHREVRVEVEGVLFRSIF